MLSLSKWKALYTKYIVLFRMSGRKEVFYLTTHSIHFIYGYMTYDVW